MKNGFVVLAALMLAACLGVETGIDIKRDGSGTIDMTYRISEELFMLGTLPGNENAPPLPVGKEDFERTFSRIPGMEMTSFSEKTVDDERIFVVKAKFDSLDALVNYLDARGSIASVRHEGGATALSIDLGIDSGPLDPELAPMLPIIFDGYYMDFNISLPGGCTVLYTDRDGNKLPSPSYGETTVTANSVSFHAPMTDTLSGAEATVMTVTW
jgi:hypothetical protein